MSGIVAAITEADQVVCIQREFRTDIQFFYVMHTCCSVNNPLPSGQRGAGRCRFLYSLAAVHAFEVVPLQDLDPFVLPCTRMVEPVFL